MEMENEIKLDGWGVMTISVVIWAIVVASFSLGGIANEKPVTDRYLEGYNLGYADADVYISQNSAMCEFEFDGKVNGFLKGLLDSGIPFNNTNSNLNIYDLQLTDVEGNLEFSSKIKFPCGRLEKFIVEEVLPKYVMDKYL